MQIAVLGTGGVGRALAGRFAALGHDVIMGTRSPEATLERDDHREWAAANPSVALAGYADAAAGAEIVVNATSGDVSLDVLGAAGAANLDGKVLMDLSNPLDFSAGFPPTLFVKDTDSLGERIQAAFPSARVVKTLHTMNNSVMVDPGAVGGGDHTVFVAGDDADAKGVVTGLLTAMGHTDVLDLGDISASRGTEMMMPIWLRLMSALGTAEFNFKIVRN
jgi:predicted dinucleotide-binding enzyme